MGVTKTDLADRVGMVRSTWDLIERGGRRLPPETAAAVAEILGVSERTLRQALRRGIDAEAAGQGARP